MATTSPDREQKAIVTFWDVIMFPVAFTKLNQLGFITLIFFRKIELRERVMMSQKIVIGIKEASRSSISGMRQRKKK